MSTEIHKESRQPLPRALLKRFWKAVKSNWKLKLLSLIVAITIWGALISEDASLTREKTFNDVTITITGMDTLQRNGLVIIEGLDDLQPIKIRAEVPQKAYDAAAPANYSVRADVSRISGVGRQTVPIQSSSTITYGSVEWLSINEITVMVDEYITRRRVPVRLEKTGQTPEGYYAANVSADPSNVVVSGPRSLVEQIVAVSASYNLERLGSASGIQYSAVPFRLLTEDNLEIKSNLISVTSENVLLDTLLVEQLIYPMKHVDVNLTGITTGRVQDGYQIAGISADPAQVKLAGNIEDIDGIMMLDLASVIDVTGMTEPVIRALRVEKPDGVVYLSESAVYVTIDITPVPKAADD